MGLWVDEDLVNAILKVLASLPSPLNTFEQSLETSSLILARKINLPTHHVPVGYKLEPGAVASRRFVDVQRLEADATFTLTASAPCIWVKYSALERLSCR